MTDKGFQLRPARPADLDGIMEVIADGQAFIRSSGFEQWTNGYPGRELIAEDIRTGCAYTLCCDERVAGVAVLKEGVEECYLNIDGAWHCDCPYITVHRMGVRGEFRGRGAARFMLEGIEDICRARGIGYIRVDTHRENRPMRGLLTGAGYLECGGVRLMDGQERIGYDKRL